MGYMCYVCACLSIRFLLRDGYFYNPSYFYNLFYMLAFNEIADFICAFKNQ